MDDGIFLRLLDYYRGILFLTTNRPDVLGHAIISRVTLQLEYPDLDDQTRQSIWTTMFGLANLTLVDDSAAALAEIPLNGREIRNLVRLTRLLYADGQVRADQVIDVAKTAVPRLNLVSEGASVGAQLPNASRALPDCQSSPYIDQAG